MRSSVRAWSASTSTCVFGSSDRPAFSIGMPAASSAARSAGKSCGSDVDDPDVAVLAHVLRPALGGRQRDRVLVDGLDRDRDDALALEHPGDRAGRAERAAELAEREAHVGGGAVAVVGQRLDDQRRAARAVALVGDGVVGLAAGVGARAAGDRALDVVLRHRHGPRPLDGVRERDVGVRVGPALLGGHDDGARELREELAALGVGGALLVLDRGPLGVTGHRVILLRLVAGAGACARARGSARARASSPVSSGWNDVTIDTALLDRDRLARQVRERPATPAPTALDARRADEDAGERLGIAVELERRPRTSAPGGRSRCAAPTMSMSAEQAAGPGARRSPRARARSCPRRCRAAARSYVAQRRRRRPDESSSLPIVVDSPPGSTSPSQRSSSSGVRTSTASAPRRAQQRDVLAERALQREHADAERLTSRAWPAARRPRACRARCRPSARRGPRRPWRAASRRGSA